MLAGQSKRDTCSSQKKVCGNVTVNLVPENIWFWPSLISFSLSLVGGVSLLFVIQVRPVDDATSWDHFNTEIACALKARQSTVYCRIKKEKATEDRGPRRYQRYSLPIGLMMLDDMT